MRAFILAIVLAVAGVEASGFYVGGFAGRHLEPLARDNVGMVSLLVGYQLPFYTRVEAEFGYHDPYKVQARFYSVVGKLTVDEQWSIGGNVLVGVPVAKCVEIFAGVGLLGAHYKNLGTVEETTRGIKLELRDKDWDFRTQFIGGLGVEVVARTLLAVEARYLTNWEGGYEWLVGLSVRYRL